MLIWIDESVLMADLASDHDACCAVAGIFDAVYRGEHYALANRTTLISLAGNPSLSQVTRRIVETVLTTLPITAGIAEILSARINVTYGAVGACKRISPSTWEVPLKILGLYGVKKWLYAVSSGN